tara:strand:- start:17 stop:850 length:834 start_codon:yes stop_codon:yes gene_type:complete
MSNNGKWKSKSAEKTKEKLGLKKKEEMSDDKVGGKIGPEKSSINDNESVGSDRTSSSISSNGFSKKDYQKKRTDYSFPKSGQDFGKDARSRNNNKDRKSNDPGMNSGGGKEPFNNSRGFRNTVSGRNNSGDKSNNNYKGNHKYNYKNGFSKGGGFNKRSNFKVKISNLPRDIDNSEWKEDVEKQLYEFSQGITRIDFRHLERDKTIRDSNGNERKLEKRYEGTVMFVHFINEDEARYFCENLDGTMKGWHMIISSEFLDSNGNFQKNVADNNLEIEV